jgi:hypothetical protein
LNQQWLSELGFYAVARSIGITGLTVLYAALIAAPLSVVLYSIRRKGAAMMLATAAVYIPGTWAIVHPRAAGFTLLAFSLLVALLLASWRAGGTPAAGQAARWAVIAIPLLFGIWANLHGGFVAGLLLLALATAGLVIDNRRRLPEAIARHRSAVLALVAAAAALTVTLATPLGSAIWTYVFSFRNPAISLATTEWEPVDQSPPAIAYLTIVTAFAGWLWWRSPRPRRLMPALVAAGFVLFAAMSMRNLIFVAPALALLIACSTPDRPAPQPRAVVGLAGAAAVAAVVVYAGILGPARNDAPGFAAVRYALKHPPEHGRIAAYAGASSYMLWRSPSTPVVIDGWLEHFRPSELRGNYGILRGWHGDPSRKVDRLNVGGVIAHLPVAIDALKAHGFAVEYTGGGSVYLVRRS